MRRVEPKYRRPLNTEQVIILELLYKFRFIIIAIVKDYFAESNPGMNVFKRLERLEEQGFIAKRYFDNYQLLHKPVVYYLLPAGARKLGEYRDKDDTSNINIKAIYKDATVSEQFAMHCVAVLGLYNILTAEYGDDIDFLAKSDQTDIENLPKQKSDAYVMLETDQSVQHYFIDVLDDDAHLLIDASKQIKRYINYKKSGDWALVAESPFPTILFVCNSEEASKRVQKRCEAILHKAWVLDIKFSATTRSEIILNCNSHLHANGS
jgi:hypothetical protein